MSETQIHFAADVQLMEDALLAWFQENSRPLPWRSTYTPYKVWISEIMLQQTQMDRGVTCFQAWMERFPDIASLARASEGEVLKAWEGMGYYSRARNICKAARCIMEEHGGVFPTDIASIRALPGIGPYTAAAIASIAYEQDVPCIDANAERVLSRLTDLELCVRDGEGKKTVERLARAFLQKGCGRLHNQAIMELGALVCGKKPHCSRCPLAFACLSHKHGTVLKRPVLPPRPQRVPIFVATGVLLHKGRIYVQRRMPTDSWGGLWEFPGGCIEAGESPEEAVVRELREETGFATRVVDKLGIIRHGYTTYHVTLHGFALELVEEKQRENGDDNGGDNGNEHSPENWPAPVLTAACDFHWLNLEDLGPYAMPSAHRRLANALHLENDHLVSTLKTALPQLPLAKPAAAKQQA